MALSLGSEAFDAVQALKNSKDWRVVMDAMHTQVSAVMHSAIEGPVEQRLDQTGYARGLRDMHSALLNMESPSRSGQMPRPQVRPRVDSK
jgi:hypothetical protein